MKRILVFVLSAVFAAGGFAARAPRKLELYVSRDGNDNWAGTRQRPFATLEKAREIIRARKPEGGASVFLRGGVYPVTKTFLLTGQDSGTAAAPVSYQAYRNETVRLIGGRLLEGFQPVRDPAVLERLDKEAREHVLGCDLAALGITDLGRFTSRGFGRRRSPAHLELFFQDRRMTVARWPNDGFTKIAALTSSTMGDDHGGTLGKLDAGFYYEGDRPGRWNKLDDIWVHGYWAWDWANSYEQIDTIERTERLIRTRPPYGNYGFRKGQRFYFLNILEELDQPGEYYVDREARKLYFWPPAPIQSGEAAVSLLEEPLIRVEGASHIVIRGLTLEYTRGDGVQVSGGTNVRIESSTIRNIGNAAVIVESGTKHAVAACHVYHLGDAGIHLAGGDRQTLAPGGLEAIDNHIHHMGEWSRTYQPAIQVSGVGNRIAHNLIHDGPHSAIQLSGNEHLIEFNEIHHVALETGDVGAFYMGRDWTMRGNVIRHNFFHHTGGVGMGSMGVYLDDCSGGATLFGNIFYQMSRAAFIGGGRDNTVENNIFVECQPAVQIDARGLDPRPVWHNMVYTTMKRSLDAMKPNQPPYRTRYPELAQLDKYYQGDTGVPPEGNRVLRNICFGGKWLSIGWRADPKIIEVRDNLVGEDPRFVDAANMNFQLREDSPAYKLGFQRIPVERIGPRASRR